MSDYYSCKFSNPFGSIFYCMHDFICGFEPIAVVVDPKKDCKKCKLYEERSGNNGRCKMDKNYN